MLSSGSPVGLVGSGSASIMQNQSSSSLTAYGERAQMGLDVEFGVDPASGAFFQTDGRKHDDLKQMLDSNKDGLKLEAMKRIISMIARGRDASDLFPAVVKNVVSKNIEVKKLVYVYLVRYAEEQQDLALLSISTFQRALKDPNQLIRASALRVLSSIRVPMIVPIVMLAVRESVADMSAYVRKTAAHAIPKIYALDREQKEELVTVIDKLLGDRTTLVVGSAVMAFEEVCPERVDLIHKNYRKLCNLLVDVDEWGQVIIMNMLTRYARTQFLNPNADREEENKDGKEKFYEESPDSADEAVKKSSKKRNNSAGGVCHVDLDHRLLLRQTKPLLQSRNASVVMAVAQLYHHIAPRNEVQIIAKALVRLLRAHKEVQSVVLTCIASMSTKRKAIFEPHVKSFFVRTSDPTHIKLLKLDVLTNLATAGNITLILREFQTYISSNDRAFVAATIQAIGTCAASIEEVTETCLNGLVHLLSNHDENIVAESVIVIKKLLQTKASENFQIITRMAKLLDFITVPAARAAIIWLIGEYNEKVPKIAPDVLRKIAKTFADEENIVKMQVLNLGVKLYISNPEQTSLLVQYVFTLARYDTNYDIRDRARFLRQIILPADGKSTVLSERAREIFLSAKPAPALESKWVARNNYQIGSLSHYLNMRAAGYKELSDFPTVVPDSSVRNVEGFMPDSKNANKTDNEKIQKKTAHKHANEKRNKANNFYSDSNKSSSYTNSDTTESSESSESATEEEEVKAKSVAKPQIKQKKQKKVKQSKESDMLCDLAGETKKGSSESSESSAEDVVNKNQIKKKKLQQKTKKTKETNILCDLENETKTTSSESSLEEEKKKEKSKQTKQADMLCDFEGETKTAKVEGTSDSQESSTESDESSTSGSEQELDSRQKKPNKEQNKNKIENKEKAKEDTNKQLEKSNMDLLLDLDDIPPMGPIMTPSLGGFLTPGVPNSTVTLMPQNAFQRIDLVSPSYVELKHKELLNKLTGHGLYVGYRFTRAPHLYSASMLSIELQFINESKDEISNIHLGQKNIPSGMNLHEFAAIQCLLTRQLATSILGVDFNDSTYAIDFEIVSSLGQSRVTLKPPIGELLRSVQISETLFKEECSKLRGMNEHQTRLQLKMNALDLNKLQQKVFECTNVARLPLANSEDNKILRFVGQTMTSKSLVLVSIDCSSSEELLLSVNCEKMVIGSMILNELRNALTLAFK